MHKAISIVLAGLLLALPIEQVLAQEDAEEDSWTTPGTILGASFRYQKRIDAWDIMYFGVTGELGVSDNISFSGSLLFGQGPNNELQFHIPIAGILAFVPLVLADALLRWLGDEGGLEVPSSWLKLLLMEDTHYNIRVWPNFSCRPQSARLGIRQTGVHWQVAVDRFGQSATAPARQEWLHRQ